MLGCENYAPNQNIVRFSNGAEEFLSAAENAYHKIKAVDPDIKLELICHLMVYTNSGSEKWAG